MFSQRIPNYYALPAIILSTLLAVIVIFAWQEPSSAPPGGNVSAPLNVSTTTQYKSGALGIGGVFQADNLAVFNRLKITPLTVPLPSPSEGEIYYDTNSKSLKFYNGANWIFFDSGTAAAECVTHNCGIWDGIQCVPKPAGENGLSACRRCNGVSLDPVNVADNTKDTEGSNLCNLTCAKCSSGNCGLQASNEDLFNECAQGLTSSDGCRSNYCSGLTNSCGVQTSGDGGCSACQGCTGASIACANTYGNGVQDTVGPNTCTATNYRCDGAGSCSAPTVEAGCVNCTRNEEWSGSIGCINAGYDGVSWRDNSHFDCLQNAGYPGGSNCYTPASDKCFNYLY